MNELGWFSDIDKEATDRFKWQPCLQLDGWCPSLSVWFETEAECDDFIRRDVVGRGFYPGEGGAA